MTESVIVRKDCLKKGVQLIVEQMAKKGLFGHFYVQNLSKMCKNVQNFCQTKREKPRIYAICWGICVKCEKISIIIIRKIDFLV